MHKHRHGHCRDHGRGNPWWGMGRGGRGFGDWGDFGRGFGGDFSGGFGGGRGGRRERMFGAGELRLVLLKLIGDAPRHGYQLIKAIEELTGGAYSPSPGTVYPTLSLLADEGVVAETSEGDGARKAFSVTDAGRAELEERSEEAEALMKRLADLAAQGERNRSPEILRALMNLGGVLKHRAFAGKTDPETLQQIVDIIDEAAKRIERL